MSFRTLDAPSPGPMLDLRHEGHRAFWRTRLARTLGAWAAFLGFLRPRSDCKSLASEERPIHTSGGQGVVRPLRVAWRAAPSKTLANRSMRWAAEVKTTEGRGRTWSFAGVGGLLWRVALLAGVGLFGVGWPSGVEAKSSAIAIDCKRLSDLWAAARYKLLEEEDLEGLGWGELELLRNGIYARHRMPFKPMRLRNFFAKNYPGYRAWKEWLKGRMNKMEIENAAFVGQIERKTKALEKRLQAIRRGAFGYACREGSSLASKDADPTWERWKPTPFPIAVHCSRIEAQSAELTKRLLTKKDLKPLQRKGWLHLTLLRNALFAREGMPFDSLWLRRFFRRFAWYKPKRKAASVLLSATIQANAKRLMEIEQDIGTMRLDLQSYNLDIRCEGTERLDRLSLRQKVVMMALSFLGTDRFQYRKEVKKLQEQVRGEATQAKLADRYDCSGLVESVFQGLDIDLAKPAPRPFTHLNINGVKIIHYNLTRRFGQTCTKRDPKLGDLIFFDHCWDANNNGTSKDDPLTHIGIVTGIYPDGTVEFVHNAGQGMRRRIEIGRMNLQHPFSKTQNKPSPMCSGRVPAKIFTCYGFPEKAGDSDSQEPPLLAEGRRSTPKARLRSETPAEESDEPSEEPDPPARSKPDPRRSISQDEIEERLQALEPDSSAPTPKPSPSNARPRTPTRRKSTSKRRKTKKVLVKTNP